MRCVSAAFLTLALCVAAQGTRRKSLGFGPYNPNAKYYPSPYVVTTNGLISADVDSDPFDVARSFVVDILGVQDESRSFKIREDSYTDSTTGITHVYVRQLVNGLEVVDGNMNINIKDGLVLSYGNSFFNGPSAAPFTDVHADVVSHPHQEFCTELETALTQSFQLQSGAQAPLGGEHHSIEPAMNFLADHCNGKQYIPYRSSLTGPEQVNLADPRHALLQFILAATPNSELHASILAKYDAYLDNMSFSAPLPHFAPHGEMELKSVVENVPDAVSPVNAKVAYIQVPSKDKDEMHLQLVWRFEVEMQDNWYETCISATAPHRIISVVDWASDSPLAPTPKQPEPPVPATYNVFAWGVNDPSCGNRSTLKENFDALASPMGWHSIPYSLDPSVDSKTLRVAKGRFWRNTTDTWGNNVFAQENWEGQNGYIDNFRPSASNKSFDYAYAPRRTDKTDAQDEAYSYINATVTQLFYTSNLVHDLYYRYGFDEVSGNFQAYNFERGGRQGDAVIANAQDGSGYNNANFMTPPDGNNGRMRMYLWNTALPYRDGDFEAGIVIHELSHGLSTRLTGGPLNSGCLGWGESGGMGEGWGDFLATVIRSSPSTYEEDFPMGSWAANRTLGIRNYPYSLNNTVNPSTYKTLDKPGYWGVHAIGEVWAETLWVVSHRLIAKHGFTADLFPPKPLEDGTVPTGDFYRPVVGKKAPIPRHGNSLIVQLVLNGMKLQPCQPSFFDARDAIIQADEQLTGGENFCDLWEGFASRGLGVDANVQGRTPWGGGIRTDGFKVPTTCQKAQ